MGIVQKFWDRLTGAETAALSQQLDKVMKKADALTNAMRPFVQEPRGSANNEVFPRYNLNMEELYNISYSSDTLTIVQKTLRDEIWRNGYELVEAEDTDDATVSSEDETEANPAEREAILEFLECCNENGQSLKQVGMEFEDDLNIADDAYLLLLFNYNIQGNKAVSGQLKEILTASPKFMGMVMNKQYQYGRNDEGKELLFCLHHRDAIHTDKESCPKCGLAMVRACFVFNNNGSKTYYAFNEVVHASKYRPTKGLGTSPVITVWQKTKTLLYMDRMVLEAYEGKRMPKQLMLINTSNKESVKAAWKEMAEKARENPHMPGFLAVEQNVGSTKKDAAQLLNFMNTLEEMQYMESRREMRTQIGAVYGVEPVFQGDTSSSGGLNNEGLQITVTNRAVAAGQSVYNDIVFPRILEALDVDGWTLRLKPSEEQDEMAKLDRQARSLENGRTAISLGLEAEYDSDTMEVVIKDGPLSQQNPLMGAGFGSPVPPDALSSSPEPAPLLPPDDDEGKPEEPEKKELKKSYVLKELGSGEVQVDERFTTS